MKPPLRIGVLGCAGIARRRMLPALHAEPDAEITAVASREADRALRTARPYGARPVHGYERLLERDDVDAVYVPLPAALHQRWTEAALRAGKHVLAEKPLTLEPAATEALFKLAGDQGLVLMENVMFVHHPQHAAVRRLVADGAIGELRAFAAAFAIPEPQPHDIRLRPELGGGALWDVGVYPVRAALHLLGPDLEVLGAALEHGPGRQVDTSGAAMLGTGSGVLAQLSFGLSHAYRNTYELWGSEGRITVDRAFTPPADHRPMVRLERASGTEELVLDPADQVAATVSAFVRGVRDGHSPFADESRHQALVLESLRRRARR